MLLHLGDVSLQREADAARRRLQQRADLDEQLQESGNCLHCRGGGAHGRRRRCSNCSAHEPSTQEVLQPEELVASPTLVCPTSYAHRPSDITRPSGMPASARTRATEQAAFLDEQIRGNEARRLAARQAKFEEDKEDLRKLGLITMAQRLRPPPSALSSAGGALNVTSGATASVAVSSPVVTPRENALLLPLPGPSTPQLLHSSPLQQSASLPSAASPHPHADEACRVPPLLAAALADAEARFGRLIAESPSQTAVQAHSLVLADAGVGFLRGKKAPPPAVAALAHTMRALLDEQGALREALAAASRGAAGSESCSSRTAVATEISHAIGAPVIHPLQPQQMAPLQSNLRAKSSPFQQSREAKLRRTYPSTAAAPVASPAADVVNRPAAFGRSDTGRHTAADRRTRGDDRQRAEAEARRHAVQETKRAEEGDASLRQCASSSLASYFLQGNEGSSARLLRAQSQLVPLRLDATQKPTS